MPYYSGNEEIVIRWRLQSICKSINFRLWRAIIYDLSCLPGILTPTWILTAGFVLEVKTSCPEFEIWMLFMPWKATCCNRENQLQASSLCETRVGRSDTGGRWASTLARLAALRITNWWNQIKRSKWSHFLSPPSIPPRASIRYWKSSKSRNLLCEVGRRSVLVEAPRMSDSMNCRKDVNI